MYIHISVVFCQSLVDDLLFKYFMLPDVVTTVPVTMHTSFPGPHPSCNKGRTSIGTPTNAMRNSTNVRLINTAFAGVRSCIANASLFNNKFFSFSTPL